MEYLTASEVPQAEKWDFHPRSYAGDAVTAQKWPVVYHMASYGHLDAIEYSRMAVNPIMQLAKSIARMQNCTSHGIT